MKVQGGALEPCPFGEPQGNAGGWSRAKSREKLCRFGASCCRQPNQNYPFGGLCWPIARPWTSASGRLADVGPQPLAGLVVPAAYEKLLRVSCAQGVSIRTAQTFPGSMQVSNTSRQEQQNKTRSLRSVVAQTDTSMWRPTIKILGKWAFWTQESNMLTYVSAANDFPSFLANETSASPPWTMVQVCSLYSGV